MPAAAQHQTHASLPRDVFHAPRQAREKRIVEVAGQQPQHIAASFRQCQRGGVAVVIELAHRFLDAFAGHRFNVGGIIDHPADGGRGNAGAARNVFHGGHGMSCCAVRRLVRRA